MAKENDKISEETEKQINKKKRSLCDLEAITIVTNNVQKNQNVFKLSEILGSSPIVTACCTFI